MCLTRSNNDGIISTSLSSLATQFDSLVSGASSSANEQRDVGESVMVERLASRGDELYALVIRQMGGCRDPRGQFESRRFGIELGRLTLSIGPQHGQAHTSLRQAEHKPVPRFEVQLLGILLEGGHQGRRAIRAERRGQLRA